MSRKRKATVDALYDQRFRNDPESRNLTEEENILFANARAALVTLRKTFETWTVIGKAVVAARARADRIGGGKTFRRILEQQGLGELPPATATRLEQVVARLDEVTAWHNDLSPSRQIAWAAPTTVFKRCPVFAKNRAKLRPNMTAHHRPAKANVETAFDIIGDYLATVEDADQKASMVERLAALLQEHSEPQPPKPARKKPPSKQLTDAQRRELDTTLASATAKVGKAMRHIGINVGFSAADEHNRKE